MSKTGRDRKARAWNTTTKRRFPWKPAEATHEERFQIVKKKSGLTTHTHYVSVLIPTGAPIKQGPNRAQRRKDAKWERGQLERDRKQKVRDNLEAGKLAKGKRIEKQAEANRKKSAKRRLAKLKK